MWPSSWMATAAGRRSASCPGSPGTPRAWSGYATSSKPASSAASNYLTLFAFSSENWRRPQDEVNRLMELFVMALEREVDKMHKQRCPPQGGGRFQPFRPAAAGPDRPGRGPYRWTTQRLTVTVCANYGGRWDILNAVNRWRGDNPGGRMTEDGLAAYLPGLCAGARSVHPHRRRAAHQQLPALATGLCRALFHRHAVAGFRCKALDLAIASYQKRERRFGRTSEQLLEQTP
jgi:undecaprenyl diphosphate synthase